MFNFIVLYIVLYFALYFVIIDLFWLLHYKYNDSKAENNQPEYLSPISKSDLIF